MLHTKCVKYYQITQQETVWFKQASCAAMQLLKKKEDCLLERKCRSENIIYKCIVSTSDDSDKVYWGTADGYFKKKILQTYQFFQS